LIGTAYKAGLALQRRASSPIAWAHRSFPYSFSLSTPFERALKETLLAHGETIQELDDPHSPQVRAVDLEMVRAEYYAHYPANGDTEKQRQDSTRQAFQSRAQADRLIEVRVLADRRTMLWLARPTTRNYNSSPFAR
jgi:hypothetical protein